MEIFKFFRRKEKEEGKQKYLIFERDEDTFYS